ncbi:MAG: hypothetical protein PHN56_03840 [Candidatus Nanoarchaeia archaeon]|nr:hypothetical protein [Candidatus Nanoarchaeia archaeon]
MKFKLKESYLLLAIIIYSIFLRLIYLDSDSMWIDETISATAAKAILTHGTPILDSGISYDRAIIFHYLMAFFILIFGGDFGARFISVIFGALTVYLAYKFSKKFIKKNNLIFPILIALSSLEIIYSKQARFYQAFQFLYFLSFYIFYKIAILKEKIFSKKWMDYLALIVSVYSSIHLQPMGYIIIPLFVLIYIINFFSKKLLTNKYFIAFAILGLYFVYLIIASRLSTLDYNIIPRVISYFNLYISYYFNYIPLLIFLILGIIFALKDKKFNLSLLVYSIIPFIGILFVKSFATRYEYFILFPFFFYIAYCLSRIRYNYLVLIIMIFAFYGSVFDIDGIKYPNLDFSMPLADYKAAYNYVNGSNLSIVSSWTPASTWYGEGADYALEYSITGMSDDEWMFGNVTDTFANATVIKNISNFPKNVLVILDEQARRKLSPNYLDFFSANCSQEFTAYNIEVLKCE